MSTKDEKKEQPAPETKKEPVYLWDPAPPEPRKPRTKGCHRKGAASR
jgi:hypothetical protein